MRWRTSDFKQGTGDQKFRENETPKRSVSVPLLFQTDFFSPLRSKWKRLFCLVILPCMKIFLYSPCLSAQLLKTGVRLAVLVSVSISLQACAVVAVADAAVTVVATGVKLTAKAVGAVADAVIPDSDDDN